MYSKTVRTIKVLFTEIVRLVGLVKNWILLNILYFILNLEIIFWNSILFLHIFLLGEIVAPWVLIMVWCGLALSFVFLVACFSSQVAQPSELPPSPHVWEWPPATPSHAKHHTTSGPCAHRISLTPHPLPSPHTSYSSVMGTISLKSHSLAVITFWWMRNEVKSFLSWHELLLHMVWTNCYLTRLFTKFYSWWKVSQVSNSKNLTEEALLYIIISGLHRDARLVWIVPHDDCLWKAEMDSENATISETCMTGWCPCTAYIHVLMFLICGCSLALMCFLAIRSRFLCDSDYFLSILY